MILAREREGEKTKMVWMFVAIFSGNGSRPLVYKFSWSNAAMYVLSTFSFHHAIQLWMTRSRSPGAIWELKSLGKDHDGNGSTSFYMEESSYPLPLRHYNLIGLGLLRYEVNMNSRSLLVGSYFLVLLRLFHVCGKAIKPEMLNE